MPDLGVIRKKLQGISRGKNGSVFRGVAHIWSCTGIRFITVSSACRPTWIC